MRAGPATASRATRGRARPRDRESRDRKVPLAGARRSIGVLAPLTATHSRSALASPAAGIEHRNPAYRSAWSAAGAHMARDRRSALRGCGALPYDSTQPAMTERSISTTALCNASLGDRSGEMIAIFGDEGRGRAALAQGVLLDRQQAGISASTTVRRRVCSSSSGAHAAPARSVRAHIPGPCAHRRRSGRILRCAAGRADAGRFVHDRLRAADDRAEALGRMASSTAGEEEASAVGKLRFAPVAWRRSPRCRRRAQLQLLDLAVEASPTTASKRALPQDRQPHSQLDQQRPGELAASAPANRRSSAGSSGKSAAERDMLTATAHSVRRRIQESAEFRGKSGVSGASGATVSAPIDSFDQQRQLEADVRCSAPSTITAAKRNPPFLQTLRRKRHRPEPVPGQKSSRSRRACW